MHASAPAERTYICRGHVPDELQQTDDSFATNMFSNIYLDESDDVEKPKRPRKRKQNAGKKDDEEADSPQASSKKGQTQV